MAIELDIIRDDVKLLEAALATCEAGKRLASFELADAAQAAQDARG